MTLYRALTASLLKTEAGQKNRNKEHRRAGMDFFRNVNLVKQYQVTRTASQRHLLITTGTDPEGVSARCGGDPPGPLPQPDKNPLRARIRRGLERSGLFQPMELLNLPIIRRETNFQSSGRRLQPDNIVGVMEVTEREKLDVLRVQLQECRKGQLDIIQLLSHVTAPHLYWGQRADPLL